MKKWIYIFNWPSHFQHWKGSRFQQGFPEEGEFGGPAESFYFLVLKVCARFHLHLMNGIDIGALEIHAIVIFSLEIQRRERKCWKVGENFGREVHNASMAVVVLQTKKKKKRKEKKKGEMNKEKKKRKPWVRGVVILQRDKKNTIRAGGSTAIAKCGLD